MILSFFVIGALLSPTAVLAKGNDKKHFKEGMKHEAAEEWDLAAEKFALAVNEKPKNPEYRLHLRRALFNASQMFTRRGRAAADEKDYEGAYIAFRKAYAFDPVNELAASEMARMIRLQEDLNKTGGANIQNGDVKLVPTSAEPTDPSGFQIPQKLEKLRDVPFPSGVNLPFIVKELAKELDLNVLFDVQSQLDARTVRIELRNVTAARALDYIFLQEGLFFQKVGPRTILVARTDRRTILQQLVLRTFFLANASPKDIKAVIQTAIPAQQGRAQTIVLEDAATNSVTVRDTAENIALIGRLISSLDKDRAEVVMDVAIYEVNKGDLLEFGNQIGGLTSLTNLGGVGLPFARVGSTGPITSGMPFPNIDVASIALGLPISTLRALQTKRNTKLLASTQIHAFNNEDSSARIGERVPVRTASFAPGVGTGPGQGSNVFGDVINYEQVGLTLKFKPIVFPNQDVQVAMEIESKSVVGVTQGSDLTPTFTERTIKGTARVQNNKTLLLASVAQNTESNTRVGLPLLGLIPIIGRLFTAPSKQEDQVDIVIAVTPRVIRAPAILPEDEVERPTGSVATPTSGSLEAMIVQEEKEEYLASLRRLPRNSNVQLPDQPVAPEYVRTSAGQPGNGAAEQPTTAVPAEQVAAHGTPALRPIDSSVRQLQLNQTSNSLVPPANVYTPGLDRGSSAGTTETGSVRQAIFSFASEIPEMKIGDRIKIPVAIAASGTFRSAILGLKYDDSQVAVRSVMYGDVFGPILAASAAPPFLNQNGKMYVSLSTPDGESKSGSGTLAFVEIEALTNGRPSISFERDVLNVLTADGKNFALNF